MHQRKGQEVEDRGGVQPTVQHDSGGFEFEDIARQCWMARQTVLKDTKESSETNVEKKQQLWQQQNTWQMQQKQINHHVFYLIYFVSLFCLLLIPFMWFCLFLKIIFTPFTLIIFLFLTHFRLDFLVFVFTFECLFNSILSSWLSCFTWLSKQFVNSLFERCSIN